MTRLLLPLLALALVALPARAEGPLARLDVTGADGAVTTLGERVEPPAVLHFWATWCAPCLRELPEVAEFAQERPGLAARLALVSVDTAPFARVKAFLADRLGLTDLSTLKVVEGNAGAAFGLTGYPATVFLDADGQVTRRHAGILDWGDEAVRATIADHLAGGP